MKIDKNIRECGFAAVDAMLMALFYVMISLSISVSGTGDEATAKANLAAKASDLNAAFEEVLTQLTELGDECPTSLSKHDKAVCRTARDLRAKLAAIGVTPDSLRSYVAGNPGVLTEAWSIVLSLDDDDDDLIEFDDLQATNPHVEDLLFEVEFIREDFANGVSSETDSSLSLGNFVSAWTHTEKFTKALLDTSVDSPKKGNKGKGKGKKGKKGNKGNNNQDDKSGKGKKKKDGKKNNKPKAEKKITVCHIAGRKFKKLEVKQSALAGHLGHGDYELTTEDPDYPNCASSV